MSCWDFRWAHCSTSAASYSQLFGSDLSQQLSYFVSLTLSARLHSQNMYNHMTPFLPQLQYQKLAPKQESYPGGNYLQPLQMPLQPIPSIVVNPLNNGDQQPEGPATYFASQGTLPVPEQQGHKQGQVVNPIPVLYNLLSQPLQGQRHTYPANNYPVTYGPMHNQPPIYYMPLSQMYPQYRLLTAYAENYLPMPHMKMPVDGPHFSVQQNFPIRQQQGQVQMLLLHVSVTSGQDPVGIGEYISLPAILGDSKTYYKPTKTKKNSRPKINKIVSEFYDVRGQSRKRARIEIGEPSLDLVYDHFREVLGITAARLEISQACEFVLADDLEKTLFELFVDKLALFIDVFSSYDVFQKIVPELALYDESRMILDSMFCLSSLILQRTKPDAIDPLCPLKYYQRTVNSIRFHLSQPEVESPESGMLARCLLGTCLLCIYELFFIAVDSTYIKGAASILMSILSKKNKNESLLKTSPFYEACFWVTFVCDMILSMKLQIPNVYSLERKWTTLDEDFFEDLNNYTTYQDDPKTIKDSVNNYSSFVVTRSTTVWWQHKIMLINGAIIEYLHLTDVLTRKDFESNKKLYQWQQLSKKLLEYERNMPVYLKPLIYMPSSEDRVFPLLFFKDEHTAIAALHFKLSKLAMVESLYLNVLIQDTALLEAEFAKFPSGLKVKLSKDILGILQTYDSNYKIWPVNVHSLRQASKCIEEGTEEYKQLKILAARVLKFSHSALQLLVLEDNN